ncbi:transglutaminase-like domain-containing protein [Aquibacillus salsiterrae]|uniref:Transglutaminase-like domain-containing protein n=1 Tax=Aquibacillus salsiterrae TaxID=2950439 RepID=A0A9X3WCI9_9BACI|nr:transglutaminase-like domain-containing protein [Aquibacillus salsiterrae]MDC3416982.1 transglutaminase-like domain-containing protein [Aquibacillus salsiterrae]
MFKFVKRFIPAVLATSLVFGSFSTVQAQATTTTDTQLTKGVYTVSSEVANKSDKLLVEKDGVRYIYNLTGKTNVPLQLGNGNYSVKVLEKIDGNRYKVVSKKTLAVKLENAQAPFLNSVQNVNWNDQMEPIVLAKKLTKGLKTDKQKVTAIYNYIVNNVKYDYEKAKTIKAGYIPNISDTYKTNKAICYDYASMFAAMARSLGIPTKLIAGESKLVTVYHAWNEVYLDGEWKIIDTTVDSVYKDAKVKTTMFKNKEDYTPQKVY